MFNNYLLIMNEYATNWKNLNVAIIILLVDIKIQVLWLYISFISTVVGWIVAL